MPAQLPARGGDPLFGCGEAALLQAAVRPPQGTPPGPDDRELLRLATHDPLLREAIAIADPALSHTLDRLVAGEVVDAGQLRRAARAVTCHQLRMSGRATPSGLMAGVAAVGFGPAARVRWGYQHTKSVRPDPDWLAGLVDRWERDPAVLAGLRLVAASKAADSTVRTALVARALALAAHPIDHAELGAALRAELAAGDPAAAPGAIDRLLGDLVRQRLLLTGLRPPRHDAADPLGHLLARLPESATSRELTAVRRELAGYADAPIGAGRAAWQAVTARMRRLHATDRPVRVDLGLDVEVCLPTAVRAEAEQAAAVLWAVAAGRPGPAALRAHHRDFLARYGVGRAVPLADVLDPTTGLGAPADHRPAPGQGEQRPA
ncbi:lantibiotic dehydratase, partial [Kitasatospora sp. LaBMicrA B282]|uniref:lantibiotic dehydratase n=1 Tax=Kitasatospora sp. LaBMicrA B282 TaxID=3420949 RepID=UPI003D0ECFCF